MRFEDVLCQLREIYEYETCANFAQVSYFVNFPYQKRTVTCILILMGSWLVGWLH